MKGPDCPGAVTSQGHNLLRKKARCSGFTGPGDLVGLTPRLGPPGRQWGPTFTMALKLVSPATDAGDDTVCVAPPINAVDQRGEPRPEGAHCDIGAFELQPPRR